MVAKNMLWKIVGFFAFTSIKWPNHKSVPYLTDAVGISGSLLVCPSEYKSMFRPALLNSVESLKNKLSSSIVFDICVTKDRKVFANPLESSWLLGKHIKCGQLVSSL